MEVKAVTVGERRSVYMEQPSEERDIIISQEFTTVEEEH